MHFEQIWDASFAQLQAVIKSDFFFLLQQFGI